MYKSILISGSKVFGGYPTSLGRGFLELGWKVHYFDDEENLHKLNKYSGNKYLFRLFWPQMAKIVQKLLLDEIGHINPTALLIIKGFYYSPVTIKKIKFYYPHIKLLHFNPDNTFNTWHFGNSNNWIRSSINMYDIHFTWGQFLFNELFKNGAKKIYHLPFACDTHLHQPCIRKNDEMDLYESDISFVGSWDNEREWWLSQIVDFDLKIWGNGWNKANKNLKLKWQRKEVVGNDFSKVCFYSKININIIRKQNIPAHNMRTFEIPGCKGFVLSTRTTEQANLFIEGEEIACFDTPEELRNKINSYLKEKRMREKIAQNSYRKIIGEHTYLERAREIENILYKSFEDDKKSNS